MINFWYDEKVNMSVKNLSDKLEYNESVARMRIKGAPSLGDILNQLGTKEKPLSAKDLVSFKGSLSDDKDGLEFHNPFDYLRIKKTPFFKECQEDLEKGLESLTQEIFNHIHLKTGSPFLILKEIRLDNLQEIYAGLDMLSNGWGLDSPVDSHKWARGWGRLSKQALAIQGGNIIALMEKKTGIEPLIMVQKLFSWLENRLAHYPDPWLYQEASKYPRSTQILEYPFIQDKNFIEKSLSLYPEAILSGLGYQNQHEVKTAKDKWVQEVLEEHLVINFQSLMKHLQRAQRFQDPPTYLWDLLNHHKADWASGWCQDWLRATHEQVCLKKGLLNPTASTRKVPGARI